MKGKKILIIDDDLEIRTLIENNLLPLWRSDA